MASMKGKKKKQKKKRTTSKYQRKVGQPSDGEAISPRFFGIFSTVFFRRMFYFSFFSPCISFFFVTAANCLAHIGQPIIRASSFEILENERAVSPARYRLIIIIVISRRGINHTHLVTQKNCEDWRVQPRNGGEFERRKRRGKESNKRRRVSRPSEAKCTRRNDNTAEKLHTSRSYRTNGYYGNWTNVEKLAVAAIYVYFPSRARDIFGLGIISEDTSGDDNSFGTLRGILLSRRSLSFNMMVIY